MKALVKKIGLFPLLALLLSVSDVYACSCSGDRVFMQVAAATELVIRGKVLSHNTPQVYDSG
ncbi:MAG: hypothetical protein HKM24_01260, partial [Gammaproteobacteria bacterium]|nr:hypothetical protein [Gammaproteobacteria bacterium]